MKIYECPVCHKKFDESEAYRYRDNKKLYVIVYCEKCDSKLIKSDSGEYVEYED